MTLTNGRKKYLEIDKRSLLIKTTSQTLKTDKKNCISTPKNVFQKKEETTDKDMVDKKHLKHLIDEIRS